MKYSSLLSFIAFAHSVIAQHQLQLPLEAPSSSSSVKSLKSDAKRKPLTGRFLHLTDFHPDPHYVAGATFDSGCHRRPGDKVNGGSSDSRAREKDSNSLDQDEDDPMNLAKHRDVAGRWGSGVSDCDSPMSLINLTFAYLKREWADKVDFVIWTGDSARHDIDREIPRSTSEIVELNKMMAVMMEETFGKDVVIVPSIGNNDIYPHNVLAPGPNSVTNDYLRIWKPFIPQDSRHIFERGAYFSVEVIPDKLAVISLNTLYWFDSNTLVDGCKDRSSDPGAKEMDWLDVQLSEFRDRGMQVWMSGHVPPHMGHYFDNCYLRYGDLALRYQDTIVGHLFGHMNIDHFFFIDVDELESTSNLDFQAYRSNTTNPPVTSSSSSPEVDPRSQTVPGAYAGPPLRHGPHLPGSGRYRYKARKDSTLGSSVLRESDGKYGMTGKKAENDLLDELKKDFNEMPGAGKIKLKDYAVVNVSPSLIPTYLPSIRVFTYNTSGLEDDDLDDDLKKKRRKGGHRHHLPKSDCSRPENEDKPHCVFRKLPRHYSKRSPSRSNRPLTPLGYTQFYLPDVDSNSDKEPEWKIEYSTYKWRNLLPSSLFGKGRSEGEGESESKDQKTPVPLYMLPGYEEGLFDGNWTLSELWGLENGIGDGDFDVDDLGYGNDWSHDSDEDDDDMDEDEDEDEAENDMDENERVSLPHTRTRQQTRSDRSTFEKDEESRKGVTDGQVKRPEPEESRLGNDDKEDEMTLKRRKFFRNLQKITPWKMKDLTINSYVKLSRRLVAQHRMWDKFSELMFVSSSK